MMNSERPFATNPIDHQPFTRGSAMRFPEFHYQWHWTLQSPPEALWPLVADTNRFNRDTGLPSLEPRNAPDEPLVNARRRLRIFRLGVPVEWEEEPFEWVRPYRFGVRRRYLSGPVAEMRTLTELTPLKQGGTSLLYEVWARPGNILGLIAIPAQIGLLSARAFAAAFRRYDRIAARPLSTPEANGSVDFAPGGRDRLRRIAAGMVEDGGQPDITAMIVDTIEQADTMALARMRPYELADHQNAPRQRVLEHFLLATRHGMLEMEWDVLCPLCRGAKLKTPTLGAITPQVHCETCNIDFQVNFEQSVELTFHPNPAIREVDMGEFCIAGPQTTPHVSVQQLIPAGDQRTVKAALEPGRYRLRTLGLRGGEYLRVREGGQETISLRASKLDGWPEDQVDVAPDAALTFKNLTDTEQLFILERLTWTDQAATAAEVTILQTFRDLFANEALRPGEQISVGSLTVVFTDLRGSTRLYTEIGDAPAFGLVMDHFDVLRTAINAEGGAVVKTIGDAVMAVFRRPAPALRAMANAQSMLFEQTQNGRPLSLRAGIHYGPCIAVTLNERLDYFGTTVNLAARLESFSTGQDIIISDTVRYDPEVAELLESPGGSYAAQPFAAQLKGFTEEHGLWRVALAPQSSPV